MSYNFQLGLTATGFLAGARSCAAALTSITRAGQGAASAVGRIGGAMTGALKGAGDMLFKLPEQMKAVQGMLSGLTAPLTLAASAESTATAFRVLVKDVGKADAALAAIRKLGDSTPYEFAELASAGRMLIGFGTDVGNVTDLLRRLGDMASAAQQPIGDIALIYGQVQAKGRLQAEEMLQLQERGIVITKELAQVLGVEEKQISKMMEQGKVSFGDFAKAVQMATNEGGKFAGMMEIMSSTTNGKISTLKDAWDGLLVKIGTPVNDSLKGIIDAATNGLAGLGGQADEIGQKMAGAVDLIRVAWEQSKTGELIGASLKLGALQFINTMSEGIQRLMDYFRYRLDRMAAEVILALPGSSKEDKEAASRTLSYPKAPITDFFNEPTYKGRDGEGFSGGLEESVANARREMDGLISSMAPRLSEIAEERKLEKEKQRNLIEGAQKWRDFSKSLQDAWRNIFTKPAAPAATNAPAAGGAGAGTGTGTASAPAYRVPRIELPQFGPEGTGMGGLPRESSAGKAQMLLNRFRRQAGGEGSKGWQDFLNSGVSTSGLSEQQVSAMKRMGPEGLQAKLGQISRRKGVATTDGQAEGPIRPVLDMISKNTSETVAHLKAAREEAA